MLQVFTSVLVHRLILGVVIFATDILVSRYLGPASKGYYYYLIITPTTLGFVSGIGLDYALNFWGHKEPNSLNGLFLKAVLFGVTVSIILILIVVLDLGGLFQLLYGSLPSELFYAKVWTNFLIIGQVLLGLVVMLAMTSGDSVTYARTRLVRRFSLLVFTLVVMLLWPSNDIKVIYFLLAAQAIAILAAVAYCLLSLQYKYIPSNISSRQLLRVGMSNYLARLTEKFNFGLAELF